MLFRTPDGKRFIPACAGNTSGSSIRMSAVSVHPRVCGEHQRGRADLGYPVGSSPRVRGTLQPHQNSPFFLRFIPACAGNTTSSPCAPAAPTVHPRVCGEHDCINRFNNRPNGSSPRVRGTLGKALNDPSIGRFIPACAGNTDHPAITASQHTVHPRVCGEHRSMAASRTRTAGSSPRVRGTRLPSHC